jgi:hypothetical protein
VRRSVTALAALALLGGATPALAQDEGDAVAYLALISTPTGAVAPMLSSALTGAKQTGVTFGARYGYIDLFGTGLHAFAATVDVPVGKRGSNLGFSAGYRFVNCEAGEDCEGSVMLGGSFDTRLARSTGSTPFSLGLSTALGGAFPNGVKMYSASVGMPVILEAETQGGGRVTPFITPGLGWGYGRIDDDPLLGDMSESGIRFMLGGGVTVATARGMSFGLGVQKVFIDGGDVQFGVGFTF